MRICTNCFLPVPVQDEPHSCVPSGDIEGARLSNTMGLLAMALRNGVGPARWVLLRRLLQEALDAVPPDDQIQQLLHDLLRELLAHFDMATGTGGVTTPR